MRSLGRGQVRTRRLVRSRAEKLGDRRTDRHVKSEKDKGLGRKRRAPAA